MSHYIRTLPEAIEKVRATLEDKGAAYGPTYRKVGAALGVAPQYSILVRIMEKCMRIDHLMAFYNTFEINKPLAAEFLDIACYAILAMFESSVEETKDADAILPTDA